MPSAVSDGAGYESNPLIRRRIEERAVDLATAHYSAFGFEVSNVGNVECYDLRCTRDGHPEVRVEVKDTRGRGDAITLTENEVRHARAAGNYRVDLYVVAGIKIASVDGVLTASGGEPRVVSAWSPEPESLTATQYRYRMPRA
jgi:hypothetical protein